MLLCSCLTPGATLAAARRLRIAEFARDYDKRRSGFITTSQFHRTLDMTLPQNKIHSLANTSLLAKYQCVGGFQPFNSEHV